ncbi:MAG: tRNA dimethylallyltransferase, partial [Erysipelotrichaceae bacterium]
IEEVWNLQAMKGIGYKEWKNYFDKVATKEETIALIQKNSRNFAKRQYTWFNNQLEVNWINVTTKEETLKRALEIFKK